jgi:hypothetical protein
MPHPKKKFSKLSQDLCGQSLPPSQRKKGIFCVRNYTQEFHVVKQTATTTKLRLGCSSVVECMLSICEVLDSILSTKITTETLEL